MSEKIVNLRALAIILVVLGHSIIIYDPQWAVVAGIHTTISNPVLYWLKQCINIVQMPLFFSISGYCFYFTTDKLNKKPEGRSDFLQKKFKRIIIPFIIVLLAYNNPVKMVIGLKGYSIHEWPNLIIHQVFMQDIGHLWYLPTLFIIFGLSYIFRKVQQKRFDFILLSGLLLLNIFAYKLPPIFCLSNVATYWIFFYVGFLLNKDNIFQYIANIPPKVSLPCLAAILILGTVNPYGMLSAFVSITTILLLYICISKKEDKFLQRISKNSYGIYLFHSPLIYIAYTRFPDISPIAMIFWNFILCGVVAYGITSILRLTKLKFIIGE